MAKKKVKRGDPKYDTTVEPISVGIDISIDEGTLYLVIYRMGSREPLISIPVSTHTARMTWIPAPGTDIHCIIRTVNMIT